MKVFVPMSDALLSDRGELSGNLVPFTRDLLVRRAERPAKQSRDYWASSPELQSRDHQSATQQLSSNPKLL